MNIKTTLKLSLLIPIVFACGSKSDSNQESSSSEEVTESCLAELVPNNEIEKMITKGQFITLTGAKEQSMEVQDSKSSSSDYSSYGYSWVPEETRQLVFRTEMAAGPNREKKIFETKTEASNNVSFGNLEILDDTRKGPRQYFRYTYGPKTKEEKEAIKKSLDRAKETSDKVDEKSAETLKSMVDKQKSNEVAVGDLAYWSTTSLAGMYNESGEIETEAKIRVLHGNTMFAVSANVSENIEDDLAMAKKVAQQIIDNCK